MAKSKFPAAPTFGKRPAVPPTVHHANVPGRHQPTVPVNRPKGPQIPHA